MRLMRATPVKAVAGIAVALALLLAACGDDGGDEDTDSTDTTEEATDPDDTSGDGDGSNDATTTEPLSPEDQVLAAYEASLDALVAAYAESDVEHPDLLATHDGGALSRLQGFLAGYASEDLAHEVTFDSNPTVSRLVENSATVTDCIREQSQRVSLDSGDPVGELDDNVFHSEVTMERVDATWKVIGQTNLEDPCEPG